MKSKKKIILICGVIAAVFVLSSLALYGFFNLTLTRNNLRQAVTDFCKNNLDKAVVFDNIYVTSLGNIVIENFNLSLGSDFNDNLSLLKAKTSIFHIDFIQLFRKNIKIKGIDFKNAEIHLQKSYGKTYAESFEKLIDIPKTVLESDKEIYENFEINLEDASLFYTEFFKEDKLELLLTNLSASLDKNGADVKYAINSSISSNKSDKSGGIKAKGTLIFDEERYASNKLKISGLDLSVLNPYMDNYGNEELSFSGEISFYVKMKLEQQRLFCTAETELKNFSMLSSAQEDEYPIISGWDFEIDANLAHDNEIFEIKDLKLKDKNMNIALELIQRDSKQEKTLDLTFDTGDINLANLSKHVTILKDTNYGGTTSWKGDIFIDYNNDSKTEATLNGSMKDFSLKGSIPYNISNGSLNLSLSGRTLDTLFSFILNGDSDLKMELTSSINSFIPLRSESSLKIKSHQLSASALSDLVLNGVISAFNMAYDDLKNGYGGEPSFLKKPIGIIVNNNNINLDWHADKLYFKNNANLSNYEVNASLKKGFLRINNFKLDGYNAYYNLDLSGDFARDYPYFRLRFAVKDFDLTNFSTDMKESYALGGTLNLDGEYSLGAYRMFHLLQNTQGTINVKIADGKLNGLKMQQDVNSWLFKNGYSGIDLNALNLGSFDFTLTQAADRFSFHRFALTSDMIDFYGYGKYDYKKGLNLPLTISLHNKTGIRKQARLSLTGAMLNPRLGLPNQKESERLTLFNIN